MKNTSQETDQDGTVKPPTEPTFDIGNLYRLNYYQMSTNARGVESHFIYFRKPLTETERKAFCVTLCAQRMWRMIHVEPMIQIVE
jgi:hypothetical protein